MSLYSIVFRIKNDTVVVHSYAICTHLYVDEHYQYWLQERHLCGGSWVRIGKRMYEQEFYDYLCYYYGTLWKPLHGKRPLATQEVAVRTIGGAGHARGRKIFRKFSAYTNYPDEAASKPTFSTPKQTCKQQGCLSSCAWPAAKCLQTRHQFLDWSKEWSSEVATSHSAEL